MPIAAASDEDRQMIEGKLTVGGREPQNLPALALPSAFRMKEEYSSPWNQRVLEVE